MSRYTATTKDNLEMAFGYDRPLSEYFVQVYDKDDELTLDLNYSGRSMLGPQTPPQSNSKIYEKITELMSPSDLIKYKDKIDQILMDEPF